VNQFIKKKFVWRRKYLDSNDKKYLRFTYDGLKWFPEDKIYCDSIISSSTIIKESETKSLMLKVIQEQEKKCEITRTV